MKIKITSILSAVATTTLMFATPASAAQHIISYTGVFTNGFDATGIFYAPGTDLTGKTGRMDFKLTLPTPGATSEVTATSNRLSGGTSFATVSPLSVSITLNGITQFGPGSTFGDSRRFISSGISSVYNQADFDTRFLGGFSQDSFTAQAGGPGFTLDSFDLGAPLSAFTGGVAEFRLATTIIGAEQAFLTRDTAGTMNVQSISVTAFQAPVTGVPEPESWAMLVIGFGLAGAAMRRRVRLPVA